MTAPAAPAPGPEPRATLDVGALRRRITEAVAPAEAPAAAPARPAVPVPARPGVPAPARSPVPAAAAGNRPASLRDDPVANHPLVREASALFDATIVRIEAAGSLPPAGPAAAADAADPLDPGHHGDPDV